MLVVAHRGDRGCRPIYNDVCALALQDVIQTKIERITMTPLTTPKTDFQTSKKERRTEIDTAEEGLGIKDNDKGGDLEIEDNDDAEEVRKTGEGEAGDVVEGNLVVAGKKKEGVRILGEERVLPQAQKYTSGTS